MKSATAGASAAALHACARPARAPAPEPRMPAWIVDAHAHFYDPARPEGVPWPRPDDAFLYRTVRPRYYRALAMPRPPDAVVVVEASHWVEDNEWILDLLAGDPLLAGVVGNLPVGAREFPALLDRFAARPRFRGIRIRDAGWNARRDRATFLDHLRRLARCGLTLDLNIPLRDLHEAAGLAREVPDLRVVLNHMANVPIDGEPPPETWRRGIEAIGAVPNVACKLSGLVEGTGRRDGGAPRDLAFYRRVLDVVWEAFGEDRLIYGSNWPVSERFAPMAAVQQLVWEPWKKSSGGTR